jgi:sugar phosphate isomerase/epimerase
MQLGIFAKTFSRSTLEETLDAVIQHDLHCIQFNMACAGLPSMPENIDPALIASIRRETEARQITIAALSGTFNMAHPNPQIRQDGLRRLRVLTSACKEMGTSIITICTGSRDPKDMWHWHDDNTTIEAWDDMLKTIGEAVQIAENANVTLAFEPERANVVYSAKLAHKLLTTISSSHLKVVLDPANIIDGRDQASMPGIIDEAFDLLGEHIVIAHAKDKDTDDGFVAAGRGVLNYSHYLQRLASAHANTALIIHSLEEFEVDAAVRFLQNAGSKLSMGRRTTQLI